MCLRDIGPRYDDELTDQLFEGIEIMQESTTYQRILREGRKEGETLGRVNEAQRMLRLLATERFGQPGSASTAALEAIQDVGRLEALAQRILKPDLHNWDDLLRGS
jgi:predicted transposase YdaD